MKKITKNNFFTQGNNEIIKLINSDKPFIVSRMGIGAETTVTFEYLTANNLIEKKELSNNAGIYYTDKKDLKLFVSMYSDCLKNSDLFACFRSNIIKEQKWMLRNYNLKFINSKILEPFYSVNSNCIPWSLHLKNKKVLIINPFTDSFKKQLENNFQFFEDKQIFDKDQKFVFYKSFNTSGGNHIHKSWVETFEIMKKDISKLNFDIALLGCGGYGLPLCNFIKMKLKKSAIYIGGGLQLLFGVKGKRWSIHPFINRIIEKNNKFISPSGDEIIKNKEKIEDGCYW